MLASAPDPARGRSPAAGPGGVGDDLRDDGGHPRRPRLLRGRPGRVAGGDRAGRETLKLDRPAPERYLDWLVELRARRLRPVGGAPRRRSERLPRGARAATRSSCSASRCCWLIPLVAGDRGGGGGEARRRARPQRSPGSCCSPSGSRTSWSAILLVALFAVQLAVCSRPSPRSRSTRRCRHWLESLVLPVAALLIVALPHTIRLVRGSMIEALDSEYVEAIRLRGMPESTGVWQHALPNALGPSIQSIALNAAWLDRRRRGHRERLQLPGPRAGGRERADCRTTSRSSSRSCACSCSPTWLHHHARRRLAPRAQPAAAGVRAWLSPTSPGGRERAGGCDARPRPVGLSRCCGRWSSTGAG